MQLSLRGPHLGGLCRMVATITRRVLQKKLGSDPDFVSVAGDRRKRAEIGV